MTEEVLASGNKGFAVSASKCAWHRLGSRFDLSHGDEFLTCKIPATVRKVFPGGLKSNLVLSNSTLEDMMRAGGSARGCVLPLSDDKGTTMGKRVAG